MTTIAVTTLLFIAARLAIQLGILMLVIWGVIRLIDRWRTPLPAAVTATPAPATTTPAEATTEAAPAPVPTTTKNEEVQ